ncbi:MAG: cytochrome c oxidase subunit II [Elusimicrobiota bacterium]
MIEQSNYTFGLPIAASSYAAEIDKSLHILHIGMLIIFVLWGIFFTFCLFKYRKGANPSANHAAAKGGMISFLPDFMVLAFELWLVFALGLPIWSKVKEDFPIANQSHVVEMVAEQFAWSFHYPGTDNLFGKKDIKLISSGNLIGLDDTDPLSQDDFVLTNELHVPIDKPTIIYMTSKDVIHSFFVPEFRVKQDTVPGMRIPLWFKPIKTGAFEIGCAQLCGLGHYRMKGTVIVHSPEDFEKWKMEQIQAKLASAE